MGNIDRNGTKKIIIISWCDADYVINYGQILQGCAMMHIINHMSLFKHKLYYISFYPRTMRERIRWVKKHLGFKNRHIFAYSRTLKTLNRFKKNNCVHFYQVFDEEKLKKISSDADILICGSDQIWHPQNFNKNYFLDFGSSEATRASYAASLPKSHIEDQYKKEFQQIKALLQRLDYISVREYKSSIFLTKLTGNRIRCVLDPTYLIPIEIWESCVNKIGVSGKYIFVYAPNEIDERMEDILCGLKEHTGVDDIYAIITRGKNFKTIKNIGFVDIGQFLYLIKNAECIFTSSFHAVVFATIFHKDFYCYDVTDENRGEDIRLMDLLNELGLEERLLISLNENLELSHIEYKSVDKKINSLKNDSINFMNLILNTDNKKYDI